jgi:tricarballylate dehydrogenase
MSAASYDVVVVGGGNAGFSAAHAARELGASVLLLEKTVQKEAGGNSYYTAGAFRVAFDGLEDLLPLLEHPRDERLATTVVPPYPETEFRHDMERVTEGRCDPLLTDLLVSRSAGTLQWLRDKGLEFRLMYERQAYSSGDAWVFFGGLPLGSVGGGKGLIAQHTAAATGAGVVLQYGAAVSGLRRDDRGNIVGVTYRDLDGRQHDVDAGAVVLAAGGFEADAERRERYLGPGWSRALVRGTPSNTGEVLDLAVEAGAARFGDWSSCHSVAWDAGAPPGGGNRELTNRLTRQSYPLGIVVNVQGRRFVDEGPTIATIPTPSTVARSSRSRAASPFSSSTARPGRSCGPRSTTRSRSPARRPTPSKRLPNGSASMPTGSAARWMTSIRPSSTCPSTRRSRTAGRRW